MKTLPNRNVRILVVEDDPMYQTIMEALLGHLFTLKTVSGGKEAIEALNQAEFDFILMDIHLGEDEPDGVAVMKTIRQDKRHSGVKIFAVTAYYSDRDWFIRQGFDELYTKPVMKEEILDAIQNTHAFEIS